jgi:hypothetical protein
MGLVREGRRDEERVWGNGVRSVLGGQGVDSMGLENLLGPRVTAACWEVIRFPTEPDIIRYDSMRKIVGAELYGYC